MRPSSFPTRAQLASSLLIGLVLLITRAASAQAPSIEGAYELVSRTLLDGTVIKPPNIMGHGTFTKTRRNFNFVLKDASGKLASTSYTSAYKLTPKAYTETRLFSIVTDQIGGKDIVYDLDAKTETVPVKVTGRRIQFTAPFSHRIFIFEGNKWTSTNADGAVDVWRKVK